MLGPGCWGLNDGSQSPVPSPQHPHRRPSPSSRFPDVPPATDSRAAPLVFAALRTADLAGSRLVKLLLAIRTLKTPKGPLTLDRLTQTGFKLVGERPGEEIVLGVVGKFWKPSGERRAADLEQFRRGAPAGEVLVAWNFALGRGERGTGNGERTLLTTETRIKCGDPATLGTFRRYWRIVHPGSALIRRVMLRAVEKVARRQSGKEAK